MTRPELQYELVTLRTALLAIAHRIEELARLGQNGQEGEGGEGEGTLPRRRALVRHVTTCPSCRAVTEDFADDHDHDLVTPYEKETTSMTDQVAANAADAPEDPTAYLTDFERIANSAWCLPGKPAYQPRTAVQRAEEAAMARQYEREQDERIEEERAQRALIRAGKGAHELHAAAVAAIITAALEGKLDHGLGNGTGAVDALLALVEPFVDDPADSVNEAVAALRDEGRTWAGWA